jgi:hypothetical protein
LRPFIDTIDKRDDLFVDQGDRETYSLKLGRGECAAQENARSPLDSGSGAAVVDRDPARR